MSKNVDFEFAGSVRAGRVVDKVNGKYIIISDEVEKGGKYRVKPEDIIKK